MNLFFNIFIAYVVLILSFIAAIIVHESGHLIFGFLTGYKFCSFRIFSFVLRKENGKFILNKTKNKILAGQCLMAPPVYSEDFRFVLYNLGGGFLNLILGLILFIILFIIAKDPRDFFLMNKYLFLERISKCFFCAIKFNTS